MTVSRKASAIAAALVLTFAFAASISGCSTLTGTLGGSDEAAFDGNGGVAFTDSTAEEQRLVGAPEEDIAAAESAPLPAAGEDASSIAAEDRLVIRNVALRVLVDSVTESVDEIRALTLAAGGNVTDLQVSTDEQPVYRYDAVDALSDGAPLGGYVTVRVPSEKLAEFTDDVSSLGKVLMESAAESDVTQEHVDLSARLANLQAQEARLREFFDSATKVEEMLAIESELARVRGEIESMQAQIAYLERQAAMATVTVELTEPTPVVRPAGEDWGFVDAMTIAIRAFVGTINAIIIFVGAILPIVIIGLVVFWIVRTIVRKRRPSDSPDSAQTPQDPPTAAEPPQA